MFNRILFATDGSKHAHKALEYVTQLAKLTQAEVVVLHAYESISDIFGEPGYDTILEHRQATGTKLVADAANALTAEGIKVESELLEGPLAEAILKVAEARKSDLIVIGARGLSRLQGLLLGSVSQKVIQHAECPVLVVR
jgi:nucleotide-binding universal stress UspA family protein